MLYLYYPRYIYTFLYLYFDTKTISKQKLTTTTLSPTNACDPVGIAMPISLTRGCSELSVAKILIPVASWGPGIASYCSAFNVSFRPWSDPKIYEQ